MKRRIVMTLLAGALLFGSIGSAFAKGGPPGPGNSHNGACTGNPADRIGGCK
jgi:hypothetical protein